MYFETSNVNCLSQPADSKHAPIFIYLSVSSDFSLKILDEGRVVIRISHVRRYPINVPEKTATHITTECADVYKCLIVPAEVHMMRSEESTEQPEEISPELALHTFVPLITQSVFFRFSHVIFWSNRSRTTHFDSLSIGRVNGYLSWSQILY